MTKKAQEIFTIVLCQDMVYLVKNRQVSQCMKHIDIHQHFVSDLQRQKKVVGQFV